MRINSEQYRTARNGSFYSRVIPSDGEAVTLEVPTPRGRRFIPVGNVSVVNVVGQSLCVVAIKNLQPVEGIY